MCGFLFEAAPKGEEPLKRPGFGLAAGRYRQILHECLILNTFDISKVYKLAHTKINQVESVHLLEDSQQHSFKGKKKPYIA